MLGVELKSKTVILVILILAILAVSYFVAYPQWDKLSQSKSELEIAKQDNDRYNKLLQEVQTYIDKYKNFQKETMVASKTLPIKDFNAPEFINNIADLAKTGGVNLFAFVITDPVVKENQVSANYSLQNQSISLTVSGTFQAIKNFILLLENNLRLVDIQTISLKQPSEGDVMESQITLKAYYQK
jgi:Tfp pilus assembly protein PilO